MRVGLHLSISKGLKNTAQVAADIGCQTLQTLEEYSPQLLEQMIVLVGAATVMAHSLYTFSAENVPKNHAMMLTIPFVLYGIFRYLYLIHIKNEGVAQRSYC